MIGPLETVASFLLTRRVSRAGLSRERFETWQARALRRWLDRDLPSVAAYGAAPGCLSDLPVIDKAVLMAGFERFNRFGITAEAARAAIAVDCRIGALTVGASTGTSGNRGLFVISDRERYRWLGTILAKAIPDLLWRRQRVAVILPQSTPLYATARRTGRIDLRFFDLVQGPERWRAALEAFAPTVVIAPPTILRHFAAEDVRIAPDRIFAAAETLDPVDYAVIETHFGPLEQIYMATEGLLAVTCREGRLHLAEDSVHFELEPVAGGLVSPLITSFRRQVQIMARYRMNDLLRLSDAPCPCGSPLRAVDEVVGRMDDCFQFTGPGGPVLMTPDVLRNAVLGASARIDDFRVIQSAADQVDLILPNALSQVEAQAVSVALSSLIHRRAGGVRVRLQRADLTLDTSRKLRRVECRLSRGMAA